MLETLPNWYVCALQFRIGTVQLGSMFFRQKLSEAMLTPWPPKSALRRKLEFFEKSKGGNRRDSTQSEEKLPDEN